ncbi:MAG: mono/diheme cytochrome c family protein/glucose/arabinose dehydrogenase [Planctomycetota bacterium]|jgi:mono/diheme cytochrome c family protein/glucose/arabinose dehydrogenase
MSLISRCICFVFILSTTALGQNGDKEGEPQRDLPLDLVVPDAPLLTPEQQLESFRLPRGFRIELVAAEPLVVDPVALAFDEEGRLWVAEMRGYMPNVEGTDETKVGGFIVILEDTDGDGRMDKRTEFLSDLVLPRAIQPTRGGALLIAPPELLFAKDTTGDGKADLIEVIDTGLKGIPNPEHAINGLDPTPDGWFRVANEPWEYGFKNGAWSKRRTRGGGQWGLTHDDEGLAYFNTNSDPLRGDLIPSHYAVRNGNHGTIGGANVRLVADRSTYPGRITPGVNRGYRKGTLRADFTLANSTGACGPWIYRGGALGEDVQGSAFVCEPTANLVHRFRLEDQGAFGRQAINAHPGLDFLTSTDERFRPVNITGGPDGGLYVADFARGLIQHRIYLTSFLRKQMEERELVEPHALGRIWRVVRDDIDGHAFKPMSQWSWSELLAGLGSPSGWVRDTVQRVIVEQWDEDAWVRDELLALAGNSAAPDLARMHALWCLHGVGEVVPEVVIAALGSSDGRLVRAAMRVGETWLGTGHGQLTSAYVAAGAGDDLRTRRQGLLSLSSANTGVGDAAIQGLITAQELPKELREAVLSGIEGRELAVLDACLESAAWQVDLPGRGSMLASLARCVLREGVVGQVDGLLERIAGLSGDLTWQSQALVRGVLSARRKDPRGELGPLRLASEPANLAALPGDLVAALCWPGREGCEAYEIRPLTTLEQGLFDRGREIYAGICAACHRSSGLGDPGTAPQLRDQSYVLGSEERLIRILSFGLSGPIRVEGFDFDAEMPATGFSPEDLASIATYIRREWGHGADPVTSETVRRVELESASRTGPWTVAELEALEKE